MYIPIAYREPRSPLIRGITSPDRLTRSTAFLFFFFPRAVPCHPHDPCAWLTRQIHLKIFRCCLRRPVWPINRIAQVEGCDRTDSPAFAFAFAFSCRRHKREVIGYFLSTLSTLSAQFGPNTAAISTSCHRSSKPASQPSTHLIPILLPNSCMLSNRPQHHCHGN